MDAQKQLVIGAKVVLHPFSSATETSHGIIREIVTRDGRTWFRVQRVKDGTWVDLDAAEMEPI